MPATFRAPDLLPAVPALPPQPDPELPAAAVEVLAGDAEEPAQRGRVPAEAFQVVVDVIALEPVLERCERFVGDLARDLSFLDHEVEDRSVSAPVDGLSNIKAKTLPFASALRSGAANPVPKHPIFPLDVRLGFRIACRTLVRSVWMRWCSRWLVFVPFGGEGGSCVFQAVVSLSAVS